jgi:hypothetical protein
LSTGYNCFLCDSNGDYRRYCQLLRDDPLLHARMAASGRAFARENFRLEALRRDLLQVFRPVPPRRLNLGCGLNNQARPSRGEIMRLVSPADHDPVV